MFARLDPDWQGRTVYLIGGGPSLKGFDFEKLRGRGIVVAINDAIRHIPWADCAFTIDTVWLTRRQRDLAAFGGEVIAAVPPDWPAHEWPRVRCVLRVNRPSPSVEVAIRTGGNSGFGALGMALVRRADRIGLLGYDLTVPGHFHNGYEWYCRFGFRDYRRWARDFEILAMKGNQHGARVVNCNPDSAIRCFRFGSWEDIAE